MKRIINIICTGGTIEKVYFDGIMIHTSSVDRIKKMLKRMRHPHLKTKINRIMNKDSVYLTEEDRQIIKEHAAQLIEKDNAPLVIVHGTDTMVNTGLFLRDSFPDLSVPIILTGAMIPFGFEDSDSLQNLTESFIATSLLEPGVYIVFQGEYFHIDNVRKNKEKLRFETIKRKRRKKEK